MVATHGIVKKTQKTPSKEIAKAERIRDKYREKTGSMKQIGDMKFYTLDEVSDELVGKPGTPERDAFDNSVAEAVDAYRIGEAIKAERERQHLTQEELGKRIGVQKARISRMEKGHSISLSSACRAFRALGVESGTLDLGKSGKVSLW